jgi:DNA-binding NarL/FixJ family response regulator
VREPRLCLRAVNALVRDYLDRARSGDSIDPLTPRELEVLKLVAERHVSDEIAALLLGMRDRVDLTRYAIRRGLIAP